MIDFVDLKSITELLTAAAALVAAIASFISAVKSSKAKTEAQQANAKVQEISADIRTNVLTSLNTVVRQTQALQQNQNINITVAGTGAQGLASNAVIFQPEPEPPELPEAGRKGEER